MVRVKVKAWVIRYKKSSQEQKYKCVCVSRAVFFNASVNSISAPNSSSPESEMETSQLDLLVAA